MRNLATVVLLFFLFSATPSTAEIKSVKFRSSEPNDHIFLDYFKFTNTGHVSIAVSSMSITFLPVSSEISRPNLSRFGFYLLSSEAGYQFFYERKWLGVSCSLDSKYISLLFTFQDLHDHSSFNKSFPVTYPDEYTLYFANCNALSHVTMDVRTELYNMHDNGDNGSVKDYLSAGMTKLPRLYVIFSRIYLGFLAIWIFVCFINGKSIHNVHLLMGVLLVSKAMYLLCAFEVQDSVKVTGIHSRKWDVLFYMFQFTTYTLLYTVIIVIFEGWRVLKPKVKMVLMIVIPMLQLLETILSKVIGVTSIKNAGVSGLGAMVVYTMICVVVIMTLAISVYEADQAARKLFAKCCLFWWFFIVVCVYLFADYMMGVNNNIIYSYHWEANAAEEIISLVFCIVMFAMFMPFEKHYYFAQLRESSVGDAAMPEFEL